MARATQDDWGYAISLNDAEIGALRDRWPCSNLHGLRRIVFEYDRSGDLVNTECQRRYGRCSKWDGEALVALSHDAQCLAQRLLGRQLGAKCRDGNADWRYLEEAHEYGVAYREERRAVRRKAPEKPLFGAQLGTLRPKPVAQVRKAYATALRAGNRGAAAVAAAQLVAFHLMTAAEEPRRRAHHARQQRLWAARAEALAKRPAGGRINGSR